MKIVRRSNFGHEDYRGDERIVAENIKHEHEAKTMRDALQGIDGRNEDFFVIVPDDYVLPPEWQP